MINNSEDISNSKGIAKSHFQVELNYGLALPFKFYIDESYDLSQEHRSKVTTIDDSGSIQRLEIITQSELGPLGGFENDVLLVLLTLAAEQKDSKHNKDSSDGYKVYYTLSEIAKRLGLIPKNWTSHISNAIGKIKSQGIRTKNFSYNASSGNVLMIKEDDPVKLIRTGSVKIGNTKSDFTQFNQVFYAIFDKFVFDNLYGQYASVIKSKEYLKLTVGPQRRAFIFLSSKREKFGDVFTFSLEELAMVLGLSGSVKRRRQIGNHLKKIKDAIGSFEYEIKKRRGEEDWDVLVTYSEDDVVPQIEGDVIYSDMLMYYGEEYLINQLDFHECDLIIYREEFEREYSKISKELFFKVGKSKPAPVADLAVDIALFQGFHHNYQIKSLKALSKKILERIAQGDVEFPDKFREFVSERVRKIGKKQREEKLTEEKKKRELEESLKIEKLESTFNEVFEAFGKNNPTYLKILREKARNQLIEKEKNGETVLESLRPVYEETLVREMAKKEWMSGEFMNYDFSEFEGKKADLLN